MSKIKNNVRSNKEHENLSSDTSSSLSSDEEEIDARDLKPIKDYLSNRKELACQLFKSVKSEKIRMMLPQVLKQMDLTELEEWCVSELNGMSKARITSILNGKPMLESSDTSESDDSGPSLEIISDTEEWTDDDISKKENGKGKIKRDKAKAKGKMQINKKNNLDKPNVKARCNIKNEINDKDKEIKIKKEDNKDKAKEGDSLLDLLELEMRARAIRALIRKEEDIIPSSNPLQTNNGQTIENNIETSQDDAKAKENCRKQLERIISAQQSNKGEDEDVVLVVQPTPIVELLSSDSDRENPNRARINNKSENVRAMESGKVANNSDENARNPSKISSHDSKDRKGIQETIEKRNDSNSVAKIDLSIKSEARMIMPERNVGIKNNTLSISISADNIAERRKRSKKRSQKQNPKTQIASSANEDPPRLKQISITEILEQSSDIKNRDIKRQSKPTKLLDESKFTAKEENRLNEKMVKESRIEEDGLADSDEVIDLDAYCDVIDIVSGDDEKSQDKIITPSQEENKQQVVPKVDSTETWASRYYQTDDVQNVIKESKIQSEIRKRLRERQRLSKLSKSPNLNLPSQSVTADSINATTEKVPMGSVEEYLALKRAGTTNITTTITVTNSNDTNNTTQNNSNNNDTMQDNPETVDCSNNIDTKESSEQNKNVSSVQECMDSVSDVQKAAVSEITVAQPAEMITETNSDA